VRSTLSSQEKLEVAQQQHELSGAETIKLQQQLSATMSEAALLRAEASAAAIAAQKHVSTIQQLEDRLLSQIVSPAPAGSKAPPSPAPVENMSLAFSEIGKMLDKKQVQWDLQLFLVLFCSC
jgi:hypothetical protein